MENESKVIKCRTEGAGFFGSLWVMGWLFTIGYLHLHVVKGLLAIVLWPYYIGAALGR